MSPLRRMQLPTVNEHVTCALCKGYLIEATAIIECLHTFCRSCIVNYLSESAFCPVCDVQVHKTKPLNSLREDRTLQDVVYKLVPDLFYKEMDRRAEFYSKHPEAAGDRTELSLKEKRHFFHANDEITLSLEFLPPAHAHAHALGLKALRAPPKGSPETKRARSSTDGDDDLIPPIRYLSVKAACPVRILEQFIRKKYRLTAHHRVDIVHGSDCLSPDLTLLEVVYAYKWQEDAPLQLQYTVLAPSTPIRKRKRRQDNNTPKYVNCSPAKKLKSNEPEDSGHDTSLDEDKMVIDESEPSPPSPLPPPPITTAQNPLPPVSSAPPVTTTSTTTENESESKNSSIESLKAFVNNSSSFVTMTTSNPVVCIPRLPRLPVSLSTMVQASSPSIPRTTGAVAVTTSPPVLTPTVASQTTSIADSPNMQTSSVRPMQVPMNVYRPLSMPHNNVLRMATLPMPRPNYDPKPRLGRPPNAARIAAANNGRPLPPPILPRGAPPLPNVLSKPISTAHKIDKRKPKKKCPIDINRNNTTTSASSILRFDDTKSTLPAAISNPRTSLVCCVTSGNTVVTVTASDSAGRVAKAQPKMLPRQKPNSISNIVESLANRQMQQLFSNSSKAIAPPGFGFNPLDPIPFATMNLNPALQRFINESAKNFAQNNTVYRQRPEPAPMDLSKSPHSAKLTNGVKTSSQDEVKHLTDILVAKENNTKTNFVGIKPKMKSPPLLAPKLLSPAKSTGKLSPKVPSKPVASTNGRMGVKKNSITMVPSSVPNVKSPLKSTPPLLKTSPKVCASPTSVPSANIPAPTPEVTITKLPNSTSPPAQTSAAPVPKSSHVNTISITKRSLATSMATKVRPSNSSVRQIPNPSLLSHQKSDVKCKPLKVDT